MISILTCFWSCCFVVHSEVLQVLNVGFTFCEFGFGFFLVWSVNACSILTFVSIYTTYNSVINNRWENNIQKNNVQIALY